MEKTSTLRPPVLWSLYAFAATAVASIALQNFIWVAVALFLFFRMKDRQKIAWPSGLFTVATLIFLATFFLGALVGVDPANSFHSVHKTLTLLLIPLVGAIPLLLKDIKKLLLLYNYGAAFCAAHGIWAYFWLHQDRIFSFSGDKMVFGGMLMVSVLLLIFLLWEEPMNPWLWGATALVGSGLLLTQTRGAWIGFLVGLVLLLWRLNRKWLLIVLILMGTSFFILPRELQNRITSVAHLGITFYPNHDIRNASHSRILIWAAGLRIIRDHPWGIGQGNIGDVYPKYRVDNADLEPTVAHLHNNFLQILVQNGWIGLVVYLFWILAYYRASSRLGPRQAPEN
ncbi:MAG TPA: O-antigen ligase family protein, partial [bacterium]|nr:O-antigen ligase family protein [bacterium]